MKKVLAFTCLFLFLGAALNTANAQDARKRVDLKAENVSSRGANPEIKGDRPTTDATSSKSRGSGSGTCYVYLHNYTAYTIDIYVDGYYQGTLAAYADNYVPTGTGYTTMYGISVGKTKEWKFSGASCSSSYDYYFY